MKILIISILLQPLFANAQSSFDKIIFDAASQLNCTFSNEQSPVTMNAQLVSNKDSIAIILKVSIAPGWHIYEYVPSSLPYIAIRHTLQLPDNIQAVGTWYSSTQPTTTFTDPGVLIYEHEALFIQKAVKIKAAKTESLVQVGLYYQTCNKRQCLPPANKTFDLKY